MAKFSLELTDDINDQLSKLSREMFTMIAPKMINAVTPTLAESVKKNLKAHKRSGELEKSIGVLMAHPKDGAWIGDVYFKGKDKETKVSNSLKAAVLEYGTHKQNATPFINKSANDVREEVLQKMQDVFYMEVGSR
jgi:HK97 gp10 family phage protein